MLDVAMKLTSLPLISAVLAAVLVSCNEGTSQANLASNVDDQSIQEPSVLQGYDPAAPGPSMMAQQAGRSRSILKFSEMQKDLGTVYQFQSYELVYPFQVEGPDPLVITEISTSCGCTDAKIYPDWEGADSAKPWPLNQPMPPNAKGRLVAEFNGERAVNDKSSTITIRGNMPEGKVILGVKAFVVPVFQVSPVQARFGDMLTASLREEDPVIEVEVTAMKEFEILRWKRVPRGIAVEELKDKHTVQEDGRVTAKYRFTATKDLPEGNLSSSVIAETSLGVDLEVQVIGVVRGAVKYAPNQRVAFGIFDEGTKKVRSIKIESTLGKVQLPKPTVTLKGDSGKVVDAEVVEGVTADSWEIKLRIGDDAPAGSYNGVLRIEYPEEAHLEAKEIVVNARIRPAR
jgi:hypothetical protein